MILTLILVIAVMWEAEASSLSEHFIGIEQDVV